METIVKTLGQVMAADALTLPIGFARDGRMDRNVELGYMTGEVDSKITESTVRSNIGKIITEVVASVVTKVGGNPKFDSQDAKRMYVADREFVMLVNYFKSIAEDEDGNIEWSENCPGCKSAMDISLRLKDIKIYYVKDNTDLTLSVILPHGIANGDELHKEVIIAPLKGLSQEKINTTLSTDPGEVLTQAIAEMTEDIPGLEMYNRDTFRDLIKKDRNKLAKALNEDMFVGPDFRTKCACPSCGLKRETSIPFHTLLGE